MLGIACLIAGIVMVIVFIAERLGLSPVWDLINIPGLTTGENVILFIVFLIGGIFAALVIIAAIFGGNSKSQHQHHRGHK